MTAQLTFAFVAGTVATVNPCGFALLPAYLARQLGLDAAGRGMDALARALAVGGLTTAGFLLVFGTIGTAISLGARSLTQIIPWAALAIGVVLAVAGLAVLTGRRLGLRLPVPAASPDRRRYASTLLFGIGYGVASLSCTLPIFLTVVGTSITGDVATGLLMFAAYAGGMGAILTALAVGAAVSSAGLARVIARFVPYATRASGALLLAAGVYIVYYWTFFLTPGSETRTAGREPIEALAGVSRTAAAWLSQGSGRTAAVLLLAGVGALLAWIFLRGFRRRAGARQPEAEARIAGPQGGGAA